MIRHVLHFDSFAPGPRTPTPNSRQCQGLCISSDRIYELVANLRAECRSTARLSEISIEAGYFPHGVHGQAPHNRDVLGQSAKAQVGSVFAKGYVEAPMEPVFDSPVCPAAMEETRRIIAGQ